jgi:serine/threonine protein kinase
LGLAHGPGRSNGLAQLPTIHRPCCAARANASLPPRPSSSCARPAARRQASDCYSFGVLLSEMLSGAPAWPGLSPAGVALNVVSLGRAPGPPPALPRALDDLLRACLARDPEVRPTMSEVAAELAAWLVTSS